MLHTMTHQTKKYAFQLSITLLIGSSLMANTRSMPEKTIVSTYQGVNGPWQCLEYNLVTKVQNELNRFHEHSFAALGIAGAAFLTKLFIFDSSNKILLVPEGQKVYSSQIKNITMVLSTLAAGKTIHNFIGCYAKRNIQRKALIDVLKKWNVYREYFPTSLVEYFDELAELYQTKCPNALTDDIVSEVFELITHHIEHHFETRYKKADQIDIGTLGTFKDCVGIWKNLE